MVVLYWILAIILFGFLIAVHELGHFTAAKRLGVKVNEFAIGMGPKIWKKQRGETLYCIRLLPIGGACVMEGEDSANMEEPDPRAFTSQSRLRRAVILIAGAAFNFIAGVIIVFILAMTLNTGDIASNNVYGVWSGSCFENSLQAGDKVTAVDGHDVYYVEDFNMFTYLAELAEKTTVKIEIVRDGQKIVLTDVPLERRTFTAEVDGVTYEYSGYFGISFKSIEVTFGEKLKYAVYNTYDDVRQVWLGLAMLISGNAKLSDLSGPVGIVSIIGDVGNQTTTDPDTGEKVAAPIGQKLFTIFDIFALIAINLAVVNMLPIPALDGGRVFGLVVTWVIEKLARRKIDPKYEGYVHAAGFILLLGLMAVIMVSDIVKIV